MNRKIIITLIIVIVIVIIGKVKVLYLKQKNCEEIETLNEFENIFNVFSREIINNNLDRNIYSLLIRKSEEIQDLLKNNRIINSYKTSHFNRTRYNYQVIVSELPKIKYKYSTLPVGRGVRNLEIQKSINLIENALDRKNGLMENLNKTYIKESKNPFMLFINGIKFFITLLIFVICCIGFKKRESCGKITNNSIVNFISAVISTVIVIINLYGAIVTIVTNDQLSRTKLVLYFQSIFSE